MKLSSAEKTDHLLWEPFQPGQTWGGQMQTCSQMSKRRPGINRLERRGQSWPRVWNLGEWHKRTATETLLRSLTCTENRANQPSWIGYRFNTVHEHTLQQSCIYTLFCTFTFLLLFYYKFLIIFLVKEKTFKFTQSQQMQFTTEGQYNVSHTISITVLKQTIQVTQVCVGFISSYTNTASS